MAIIQKKIEDIKAGKVKIVDNVKYFLKQIRKQNKKINAFVDFDEHRVLKEAELIDENLRELQDLPLLGLCVAVKANINVIGYAISCSSYTLANYKSAYDAEVVQRIKNAGGIILGITNCDEFGCGSSGENSYFGYTNNPAALGRIPGGSSSGSAAAVAAEMCDLAIGSDTGGSLRNPASHCGIIGVKPTYGRVPRYGLIDLSMSLDQIGPLSKEVYGSAALMEVLAGSSPYDARSIDHAVPRYTAFQPITGLRIGLSPELKALCIEQEIYTMIEEAAAKLAQHAGTTVTQVALPHVDLAVQTYYPIVYVEFFSGTRKFDGRKYGRKIEESCGEEVLRRILGGREISRAEYQGRYYRKALMVKQLITQAFAQAFTSVDVILAPTTPRLPHPIGTPLKPEEMYSYDAFTIPVNLAGLCAGVIPCGRLDGIPVGLQIIAPAFREDLIFNVMKAWEESNR